MSYAPQNTGGVPPYNTPYNAGGYGQPTMAYAGVGKRFVAEIIDGIIIGIPIAIIAGIGGAMNAATNADGTAQPSPVGIVLIVIAIILGTLYEPLMTARKGARNGQTIGKGLMGVRVVRTDGAPVTAGTSWLRFIIKQLISGSVLYLGFLWALWDKNKQTWHDKIANTYVVNA